ncbi:hypothetical protein NHX12_009958 [Muraenolepis orangiensis]|uniref:Telomerase-binding protein EST1A n=1 Tax=Muraenolepis orangiensis TaxID=630683 RepID=A0A9Q0DI70_9TELE|nr:hypothetical protein NHX12_009958 [Muraenolepis orangiensis]
MAEEVDRVQISAAELRAEASNFSTIGRTEDHQEPHGQQQQQKKREAKRPNLNIYQPMAGQVNCRHDNEGENTPLSVCKDPEALAWDSHDNVTSPHDNKVISDKVSEGHKRINNSEKRKARADSKRQRGNGGNSQNCRKAPEISNPCPRTKEQGHGNDCSETHGEHHEEHQGSSGSSHLSRKSRKPDQQFYQPGSRRSTQGKEREPEADRESQARPPSDRIEAHAESPPRNRAEAREEDKHIVTHEEGGREPENQGRDVTWTEDRPHEPKNRKKGKRDPDRPPSLPVTGAGPVAETLVIEVGKLSLKETEEGATGKEDSEAGRRRAKVSEENQERRADAGAEQERATEASSTRNKPDATNPLSSKRYSKSDIRRTRTRTYSSSSASSATSFDTPGRRAGQRMQWSRSGLGRGEHVEGRKDGNSHSWATNGQSSLESLEGSDASQYSPRSATPQTDDSLHSRHGSVPRGRGRGILVLPAHTDLSNTPGPGPRLLLGGARAPPAGRGRGGRGGSVRRLWDPNNPDQKPALNRSQHSPLQLQLQQKPMYLQTGGGYGQLHFLDTDDEVAGSPPVYPAEGFQSQQAAMAYYKFQNSDNPYGYTAPSGSPHSAGGHPAQRYTYPFPMSTSYPMGTANGMYPATPEEVEQQNRGELGRMLRAADKQELQISNLLSRDNLSSDGLDRMSQLRAELLNVYEQVILTDIEFSDSQNVDHTLWKNVYHQVIERFRLHLKESGGDQGPRIRNMLLALLNEGATFFDALLQKLQTVFHFKLEDYMDGVAIRARPLRKTVKYALISAQRYMICQGDIARYREQTSDSANYGKARSWYLRAQQIAPKNGRPYNQLALLAVYTKRKLDAVYYYMRSLAASNPILTAKESLMSLFEEAKRKADQLEQRRKQDGEGGAWRGPAVRGQARGPEGARVELWIRPPASGTRRGGGGSTQSSRDSEQDGELSTLSASDLNKRFILSFLHAHGKLFTKVGMESFPEVAGRVLQEFRALLQHSPAPLGSTRTLQIITINMFTIHYAHSRGNGRHPVDRSTDGYTPSTSMEGEVRSVLHEQSTALGLAIFALLIQRCTELLKETPAEPILMENGEEAGRGDEAEGMVRVSAFPSDLRELLPSIKVWSDWMLGHPDEWNPPPCGINGGPDVWRCLADLCNALARVEHDEAPLYTADTEEPEGDEELSLLLLEEDKLLAGFIPLLAAPLEPCYTDAHTDTGIAADCKRVTVLKYFLEALCGQEEPLLAFKGGKYVSMATAASLSRSTERGKRKDSQTTEMEGDDNDIRELRARRSVLTNKLAEQQKRRDKIQAVLQTGGQLELEVCPYFLVPDTNGFIDHLDGLQKLLQSNVYILVVPLIVITELDGLAKGQDSFSSGPGVGRGANYNNASHVRAVQEKARQAVAFLERGFEARQPGLRALTSRGNQLESIAFRSEDTSRQQGNNDDVILSCCLHYCKDKAKDFMPETRGGPVRLHREVVLLTDDRNLRVKALTRNVPVRDIPAFLSWAKVG